MDSLWSFTEEMNDHAENALLFSRLWNVVRLILTTPHSNAEEERFLTIVQKNKTCFWPMLDPEEILASIITVKLVVECESAETFNVPREVLTAAKMQLINISCLTCSKKVLLTSLCM